MVSTMLTAKTQRKIIDIRTDWLRSWRGTGRPDMSGSTAAKTRLERARSDGNINTLHVEPPVNRHRRSDRCGARFMRRPCAAMGTMQPGNPLQSAARAEAGAGSAVDWDRVR